MPDAQKTLGALGYCSFVVLRWHGVVTGVQSPFKAISPTGGCWTKAPATQGSARFRHLRDHHSVTTQRKSLGHHHGHRSIVLRWHSGHLGSLRSRSPSPVIKLVAATLSFVVPLGDIILTVLQGRLRACDVCHPKCIEMQP